MCENIEKTKVSECELCFFITVVVQRVKSQVELDCLI